MHTGGCFCGAVRYEAEGAARNSTWCHCSMCRRSCGAPGVAWFSVLRGRFRYVRGQPAAFHSSPGVTREFCAACGTQLTFVDERSPLEVDVTTCSLDEPDAMPPQDHTFAASRLHWEALCDDLPRYSRTRSDGALESA
ncbi:GFA family protein [Pseudoduganella sp. DS3]|uniref:GFA family protein n=1 Tax=Pseudoduganella guangdongensis TaxID=2692179 RepID=A0A6N9HHA9_9BURK|nr:GFA family protein [Pseudoduganella guangdongensis]MYN03001.1 GFA family protein [Pseudoduganella guangdongensis]